MTTSTRVMVVDSHPVSRHGLTTFINTKTELRLVGEASNGDEALRLSEIEEPDVIIIDLAPPEQDGIASIRAIRIKFPSIYIIALATLTDEHVVRAAFLAGANGYLLNTMALEELAQAIQTARTGVPVLSPKVSHLLIKTFTQQTIPGKHLTRREREVLDLMVDGLSNAKIASKLGIGRETVKSHISNILAKLGVKSRIDAIILSLHQQLPPE